MEPVFPFALTLPDAGTRGLVRALQAQLRTAILDRRLPPGTALPSTRRVAAACGIARNTVVAAYERLAAEGYTVTRAGARSVVADVGVKPRRGRQRARSARFDERLSPVSRRLAPDTRASHYDGVAGTFEIGIPEHRELPLQVWQRLLGRALRNRNANAFGYQAPNGLPTLRTAIAQHVAVARGVACTAGDIIVTSGAKQAFDLIARALVTPGRTRVALEEPGYPSLRATMAAAGAKPVPVPVDDEGLCVDRLCEDVRIVCVTPSHQYPSGVAMSLPRRAALLQFARKHRAAIIEDDYDSEFRYGGRPLDALQTLDRDANVFYVGTFSKSLFPSLRVGYLVAPPWAHGALGAIKHCMDTHGNTQIQQALADFILEGHLAQHVRKMHKLYAGRRQRLLDFLDGELRPWLQPLPSEAGLHLATKPVDPQRTKTLFATVRRQAPGVQTFDDFAAIRGGTQGLVFGFGRIDEDAIRDRLYDLPRFLRRPRVRS